MYRDYNIDIIKALAIVFVISIHSLFHVGFYETAMSGMPMLILTVLRTYWVTCVPLFLIATGWLQGDKMPNKKHYLGLIRVLVLYLICGVICQVFIVSLNISKGVYPSIIGILCSFSNFTAAPYGWYIGMFVGLYLLLPFVNILWKQITIRQQQMLMLSLVILTILPNTLNSFNFESHLIINSSKDSYTAIADSFWVSLYPLTYYCVGMYMREQKEKIANGFINKKYARGGVIVLTTVMGLYNYLRYEDSFGWSLDVSYGGLQPFLAALSIVSYILVFNRRPIEDSIFKKLVEYLSVHTLPIYLLSYVTDAILYRIIEILSPCISWWLLAISIPLSVILASAIAYPTMLISTSVSKRIVKIIENK